MRKIRNALATAAACFAIATAAQADTLAAPVAATNNGNGIMFDVSVGAQDVKLTSIANSVGAGTYDFAVYVRNGGIGGAQEDAASWTLLNNFAALTTNGQFDGYDNMAADLTDFDIVDIVLAANQSYGFYVTDIQGAFSTYYSNALNFSTPTAANTDLSILPGFGIGSDGALFADANGPRNFNGALTYVVGSAVPEPASWAMMIAGFGLVGGLARRRATLAFA